MADKYNKKILDLLNDDQELNKLGKLKRLFRLAKKKNPDDICFSKVGEYLKLFVLKQNDYFVKNDDNDPDGDWYRVIYFLMALCIHNGNIGLCDVLEELLRVMDQNSDLYTEFDNFCDECNRRDSSAIGYFSDMLKTLELF